MASYDKKKSSTPRSSMATKKSTPRSSMATKKSTPRSTGAVVGKKVGGGPTRGAITVPVSPRPNKKIY